MNRLRMRLKNNKGFTIAELLITVLILLMVSSVVAAGMPSAVNALGKVVDAAHAESLFATTYTALRDELSTAIPNRTITASGKSITYTDSDGIVSKIESKDDGIYITKPAAAESGNERLLISKVAATENLYMTFQNIKYSSGIVEITDLAVNNSKTGNTVNNLEKVMIRIVGYEAIKAA